MSYIITLTHMMQVSVTYRRWRLDSVHTIMTLVHTVYNQLTSLPGVKNITNVIAWAVILMG